MVRSSPTATADLPSGRRAANPTVADCRQRFVPRRATAPGGNGSPCRSRAGGWFCQASAAKVRANRGKSTKRCGRDMVGLLKPFLLLLAVLSPGFLDLQQFRRLGAEALHFPEVLG